MASPGNQHCANCIGTLSIPIIAVRLCVAFAPSSYHLSIRPTVASSRVSLTSSAHVTTIFIEAIRLHFRLN